MTYIKFGTPSPDTLTAGADAAVLYGHAGNDTLTGSNLADQLFGEDGDDSLSGRGGDDLIDGGNGNDNIDAGAGNDIIVAGAGNDTLYGGAGINYGGAGTDIFVFDVADNTGQDLITDFKNGRQQTIEWLEDELRMTLSSENPELAELVQLELNELRLSPSTFEGRGDVVQLQNAAPNFNPLNALTDGPIGAVLDLDFGDNITFLGRLARELYATDFELVYATNFALI